MMSHRQGSQKASNEEMQDIDNTSNTINFRMLPWNTHLYHIHNLELINKFQ
jgi:hypothetical protein